MDCFQESPRSRVPGVSTTHSAVRLLVSLAIAGITLVVPGVLLEQAGVTGAGVIGLAGLAATIASATLGWRVGALAAVVVTAGVVLADAAAGSWLTSTLVMVAVSAGYGLSATRGWQRGLSLVPIAIAFVIASPPSTGWSGDRPLLAIAVVTAATAAFGVVVSALLTRHPTSAQQSAVNAVRARGYAIMLAIAAVVTTPIAVLGNWGHPGGWLIMTPLIVIQPQLHDAVEKSWRRALGTIIGFVIAFGCSVVIPAGWGLYVIGAAFAGFALFALGRSWSYSIFATALTVAVVLLEGTSTSVADTGRWRLLATLLGVGVAIAIVAAMAPLYKKWNRRADTPSHPS